MYSNGQTFLHPTVGLNSTFSGGCPEHTCSGFYYDDGGPSSNYSPGINNIYQTFCPDQDDVCLRATFSEFNSRTSGFASRQAFLRVLNGPAQNSPQIGFLYGNYAASVPIVYTSSHSSGCLTFRFTSNVNSQDGSRTGWTSQFSCVPCAARQPNGLSDCLTGAQQICNSDPLSGASPGPGSIGEGCGGCAEAEGETFAAWYYFDIATSGTLAFDIVPLTASNDLDFALYGPNVDCTTLGNPVRCQYAQNTGNGGMAGTGGVNSSDVSGPAYVNQLNVNAGEQYVLLINNWTEGGGGYTINWTGSAGIDCTPSTLPVELLGFSGQDKPGFNELTWSTSSERDNDYFRIERSTDGYLWYPVADVKGAGNSSTELTYSIQDKNVENNIINYYRLKQFDFDGTMKTHEDMVAILNNHAKPHLVKVVNTLGQEVSKDTKGLVFEIYSDGSRVKKFND